VREGQRKRGRERETLKQTLLSVEPDAGHRASHDPEIMT